MIKFSFVKILKEMYYDSPGARIYIIPDPFYYPDIEISEVPYLKSNPATQFPKQSAESPFEKELAHSQG